MGAGADAYERLPNMTMEASVITERIVRMVQILRRAHPRTPIVLVEHCFYQNAPLQQDRQSAQQARNNAQRKACEQLQGVPDLHVVPDTELLGDDFDATVDGIHPTDLGFMRLANALPPVLTRLLPPAR